MFYGATGGRANHSGGGAAVMLPLRVTTRPPNRPPRPLRRCGPVLSLSHDDSGEFASEVRLTLAHLRPISLGYT